MRVNSGVPDAAFPLIGIQLALTYCSPFLLPFSRRGRAPSRCCVEFPHRVIIDPSRNTDRCPTNEPVVQTNSGTDGTPTVVNKRKYKASAISALSPSSPGSSSTPSSRASDVDRENSIPGQRLVFRLPRRGQVAKRPRLDVAQPEGGVAAPPVQTRQTLAPPPVFRRRPATPFNRSAGETGTIYDQGGGSGHVEGNGDDEVEADGDSPDTFSDRSSDISLDAGVYRLR